MGRLIGIINGEGIGEELIDAAFLCLQETERIRGETAEYLFYDGPITGEKALDGLRDFYHRVRDDKGVILRGSVHAPLCYRLRKEFDLFYKLVFLKPMPELTCNSPFREAVLNRLDILLIRLNNQGPYHGRTWKESASSNPKVSCCFDYDEQTIGNLAEVAFRYARGRGKRLFLLMKAEVLGEVGKMWTEVFKSAAGRYPDVNFDWDSPDSGSAQIFMRPSAFDTIVAPDIEADMLADQLAVLIHGTRAVTPSANFSTNGFATYQTLHGTARGLKGKNVANPAAMMLSAALLLELSLGWKAEAEILRRAVADVLKREPRTVVSERNDDLKLRRVNTKEFAQLVVEKIAEYGRVKVSA